MNPWMFVALLAGSFLPVQAGVNFQLGRLAGHPLLASLISFTVGTVALLALCLAVGLRPRIDQLSHAPAWMWVGGLLGAFLVAGSIYLAPRLGATTMVGFIVAGQLLTAVALDHYGIIGYAVHPVSPGRLIGVALLLLGMVLIQRF